jgi:hypothetical protein
MIELDTPFRVWRISGRVEATRDTHLHGLFVLSVAACDTLCTQYGIGCADSDSSLFGMCYTRLDHAQHRI